VTRVRRPAGVGVVYPSSRDRIVKILRSFIREEPVSASGGRRVSAVVVPHGPLRAVAGPAAAIYRRLLQDPDIRGGRATFVIVGPNHSELGAPVAVYPDGVWLTPLGEAGVDGELAREIARVDRYAELDEEAHSYEYSAELQLIFLQLILGEIVGEPRFVAIAVSDIANRDVAESLSHSIAEAARKLGRRVVVIATSEFGYYYSREEAVNASRMLVECLRRLDDECFYRSVKHNNMSLCAPAALGVAALYSKISGCSDTEYIRVKFVKFRSPGFYTPYISATITCRTPSQSPESESGAAEAVKS